MASYSYNVVPFAEVRSALQVSSGLDLKLAQAAYFFLAAHRAEVSWEPGAREYLADWLRHHRQDLIPALVRVFSPRHDVVPSPWADEDDPSVPTLAPLVHPLFDGVHQYFHGHAHWTESCKQRPHVLQAEMLLIWLAYVQDFVPIEPGDPYLKYVLDASTGLRAGEDLGIHPQAGIPVYHAIQQVLELRVMRHSLGSYIRSLFYARSGSHALLALGLDNLLYAEPSSS